MDDDILFTNRYIDNLEVDNNYDISQSKLFKKEFTKYIKDQNKLKDPSRRNKKYLRETSDLLETNPVLNKTKSKKVTHEKRTILKRTVVNIDSINRNKILYPDANRYTIDLNNTFRQIKSIKLLSTEIPNTEQLIKFKPDSLKNNQFTWSQYDDFAKQIHFYKITRTDEIPMLVQTNPNYLNDSSNFNMYETLKTYDKDMDMYLLDLYLNPSPFSEQFINNLKNLNALNANLNWQDKLREFIKDHFNINTGDFVRVTSMRLDIDINKVKDTIYIPPSLEPSDSIGIQQEQANNKKAQLESKTFDGIYSVIDFIISSIDLRSTQEFRPYVDFNQDKLVYDYVSTLNPTQFPSKDIDETRDSLYYTPTELIGIRLLVKLPKLEYKSRKIGASALDERNDFVRLYDLNVFRDDLYFGEVYMPVDERGTIQRGDYSINIENGNYNTSKLQQELNTKVNAERRYNNEHQDIQITLNGSKNKFHMVSEKKIYPPEKGVFVMKYDDEVHNPNISLTTNQKRNKSFQNKRFDFVIIKLPNNPLIEGDIIKLNDFNLANLGVSDEILNSYFEVHLLKGSIQTAPNGEKYIIPDEETDLPLLWNFENYEQSNLIKNQRRFTLSEPLHKNYVFIFLGENVHVKRSAGMNGYYQEPAINPPLTMMNAYISYTNRIKTKFGQAQSFQKVIGIKDADNYTRIRKDISSIEFYKKDLISNINVEEEDTSNLLSVTFKEEHELQENDTFTIVNTNAVIITGGDTLSLNGTFSVYRMLNEFTILIEIPVDFFVTIGNRGSIRDNPLVLYNQHLIPSRIPARISITTAEFNPNNSLVRIPGFDNIPNFTPFVFMIDTSNSGNLPKDIEYGKIYYLLRYPQTGVDVYYIYAENQFFLGLIPEELQLELDQTITLRYSLPKYKGLKGVQPGLQFPNYIGNGGTIHLKFDSIFKVTSPNHHLVSDLPISFRGNYALDFKDTYLVKRLNRDEFLFNLDRVQTNPNINPYPIQSYISQFSQITDDKFNGKFLSLISEVHGYERIIENVDPFGLPDGMFDFIGEKYILMVSPMLKTLGKSGNVDNIFAKLLLVGAPGNMIYNSFISNEKTFEETPLTELSELSFEFKRSDNEMFEFNLNDHSFSLEILEYVDVFEGINVSSRRGIQDTTTFAQ